MSDVISFRYIIVVCMLDIVSDSSERLCSDACHKGGTKYLYQDDFRRKESRDTRVRGSALVKSKSAMRNIYNRRDIKVDGAKLVVAIVGCESGSRRYRCVEPNCNRRNQTRLTAKNLEN